ADGIVGKMGNHHWPWCAAVSQTDAQKKALAVRTRHVTVGAEDRSTCRTCALASPPAADPSASSGRPSPVCRLRGSTVRVHRVPIGATRRRASNLHLVAWIREALDIHLLTSGLVRRVGDPLR